MVRITKRSGVSRGSQLVEFSGKSGNGGLIDFHEDEQGRVHVTLYRLDPDVKVQVSRPDRDRSRARRR